MIKKKSPKTTHIIPVEQLARQIYLVRGLRVMLDSDLAELYGVPTGRLNEQVKRNIKRFPEDFMLQLTQDEYDALRSQIALLKTGGRGRHRKYLPRVFTEQGVAMLSSVLQSERAVQMNILIIRTFVKLREMLATHKDHYCPVKSRIESAGWGHRVSCRGSRTAAKPVKWAFSRIG